MGKAIEVKCPTYLRWLGTPCKDFFKTLPKVASHPAYQNSVTIIIIIIVITIIIIIIIIIIMIIIIIYKYI